MKIKKRFISAILVLSFTFGMLFSPIYADPASGTSFVDELLGERDGVKTAVVSTPKRKAQISDFADVKKNDWFYPYLEYLVNKGTINGKTENSFEPTSTFSYAECSAVIVRYLGLEDEAAKRQKQIVSRLPELKNQWFAGYFEVLSELGIFSTYGLYKAENGKLVSLDKVAANSPIVRYRFAESVVQSFELRSGLKAKNVYSEIGGSGREFILGGAYKQEVLDSYKAKISDFDAIPETSRESVLKAYYNGIFNGDVSGNFYPENNLNRAEMAKVLAAVMDYSYRTRLISEGYAVKVTNDMLHTDALGEKTLKYDKAAELLLKEAEGITMYNGSVVYRCAFNAPEGYAIDVYLYQKEGAKYKLVHERTLRDWKSNGFTYYAPDSRVLLVLRNVKDASSVEGVVDVMISGGQIVSKSPMIRQM